MTNEIVRLAAEEWRRQIVSAGADENVAQQTIALAALNGLFDIYKERGADSDVLSRAQAFVDRKYTAHADARQKAMGLAYVEAERADLAREMARFAAGEVERAAQAYEQKANPTEVK